MRDREKKVLQSAENVTGSEIPAIVEEISRAIGGAADPQYKQKLARLVPGASIVGVPVPKLRGLVQTFRATHPGLSLNLSIDIMEQLCRHRRREEVLFGAFLLGGHGKKLRDMQWQTIARWLEAIDNWEACDQLASNVSGPVVAAHLDYVDHLVVLARSDNRWKRRFALATASELNHKGMVHATETLRICDLLLDDPEPVVWNAVAWAIKEVSKKNGPAAYEFLQANRERISAPLLREASEKLPQQSKRKLYESGSPDDSPIP